jgi:methylmalonyl-CoA mutase N-terminal domain/subunit
MNLQLTAHEDHTLMKIDDSVRDRQIKSLQALRQSRDNAKVEACSEDGERESNDQTIISFPFFSKLLRITQQLARSQMRLEMFGENTKVHLT